MLLMTSSDVFEVDHISASEPAKAYIRSIFKDYIKAENMPTNMSVTLLYAEARESYSFEKYQKLGDWIFFSKTVLPGHLVNASDEYYIALAQNSYYNCYLLTKRQWKLFEEMADNFEYLSGAISL
jgi:hypothetical protein